MSKPLKFTFKLYLSTRLVGSGTIEVDPSKYRRGQDFFQLSKEEEAAREHVLGVETAVNGHNGFRMHIEEKP